MNRRGYTIVEVLAVLAIMGLLAALIFPAVNATRAASRRLLCQNQLRQFGVATQNYHDSFACLPVSSNTDSHWVQLLPFMDSANDSSPFHQVFAVAGLGQLLAVDGRKTLPATAQFQCPALTGSSFASGRRYDWEGYPPGWIDDKDQGHRYSYVGNAGAVIDTSTPGSGAISPYGVRCKDIVDGLSHTAMYSEILSTAWRTRTPIYGNLSWTLVYLSKPTNREFADACRNLKSEDIDSYGVLGETWTAGYSAYEPLYSHTLAPGHASCRSIAASADSIVTAGSEHPGDIVNLLRCDGGAEAISYSIDEAVWRGLGTRAGGEAFELP